MSHENSLRGCIITKWKAAGSKEVVEWGQVLTWAKECDQKLKKNGYNPADVFRKAVESNDERRMKAYLRGERFKFEIVDDATTPVDVRQSVRSSNKLIDSSTWRACLRCGRLNLVLAVYCSYCGHDLLPQIRRSGRG